MGPANQQHAPSKSGRPMRIAAIGHFWVAQNCSTTIYVDCKNIHIIHPHVSPQNNTRFVFILKTKHMIHLADNKSP